MTALMGKVAVVTGAGSGIGEAIARRFAEAGAHVVVAGRTLASLQAVATDIAGTAAICDVTDLAQVEAMFATALSVTGQIDVLVANAGQSGPVAPITTVDPAAFRDTLELNIMGVVHCLQVGGRMMERQRHGSIITMSSRMGLHGYPMRSAYCASKFAILGLTEAVARELGPAGVRVNALCPGAVSGALMDRVLERRAIAEGRSADDIARAEYTDVAALRRWVDPREVADAALFLASDASAAITGDRFKVDCGRF
jgi:NAD(P)-dependent dehydrogenase (short-subunit alcohol dehydrogenase family)